MYPHLRLPLYNLVGCFVDKHGQSAATFEAVSYFTKQILGEAAQQAFEGFITEKDNRFYLEPNEDGSTALGACLGAMIKSSDRSQGNSTDE